MLPIIMISRKILAQCPGISGFHDLCIGSHPTQFMMELRATTMFKVTKMNHTAHFTQPSANRSNVTAKAVLLHAAAVMASVFRTHMIKISFGEPQY